MTPGFLGLDASTSVVGWCLLDEAGNVADAGAINLKHYDTLYQKLRMLRNILQSLTRHHTLKAIFLEEPKKMFGKTSTAHVISLLQRWNGMVSGMLALEFIEPDLVNERTARKAVGVTIPHRCASKETKRIVAEHVKAANVLSNHVWQYKKTGNLKDQCYDVVDAYVVARAGFLSASAPIS